MSQWVYDGRVMRWVDGDTLWLTAVKEQKIDFGFRARLTMVFEHDLECRLYGVDTPENNAGKPAAAAVNLMAPAGSSVKVETFKPNNSDKYGRWLADLTLPDGRNVTVEILSQKLGVPYFGGTK
jgi:endonuclease YncB( thermonuclease family)